MKQYVVLGSNATSPDVDDIEIYKNEEKAVDASYEMAKRFAQKALANVNANSAEVVTTTNKLKVNIDGKTVAFVTIRVQTPDDEEDF